MRMRDRIEAITDDPLPGVESRAPYRSWAHSVLHTLTSIDCLGFHVKGMWLDEFHDFLCELNTTVHHSSQPS